MPDSRLMPSAVDDVDALTVSVWVDPAYVDPAYTVIRLTGEWDLAVCDRLRGMLVGQVQAGARNLVVDLSEVAFLDLSCLYALLAGGRTAEQADGTLQLLSPQPLIIRLMTLLGADRLIAVRTSMAQVTGLGRHPAQADQGLPDASGVVARRGFRAGGSDLRGYLIAPDLGGRARDDPREDAG